MSTVGLPLSSPSKKRKHREDDAGPSTKKSKKEWKHKHKHKHGDEEDSGEFMLVQASLVVSIPPVFALNPEQGVEEMLDSMVMRYIPTLHGVVLTHSNLRFLESTARVQGDSPFAVCNVGFDATVWSPRVGQRLTGKVNLCSPDHVSLLVHRTFNVSIPRHHIPKEHWVFEYGPAENDPEYGAGAASLDGVEQEAVNPKEEDVTMADTGDAAPTNTDAPGEGEEAPAEESAGRWVHALTGSPLGEGGKLEFTVIGMTIANQMLSLVGSIQPDPFSPDHVASAQEHDVEVDPAPAEDPAPHLALEEEDSEPESDIFAELGRRTDKMAREEEEARRRAEDEKARAKAEKKKRKKDAEGGEKKRKKGKDAEGGGEEKKPKKKKKKHEDK